MGISIRSCFLPHTYPQISPHIIPKHKEEATDDIREKGERG
jgi:hypothetical protein